MSSGIEGGLLTDAPHRIAGRDQRGLRIVEKGADQRWFSVGIGCDRVAALAVFPSRAIARRHHEIFLRNRSAIRQMPHDLDSNPGTKRLSRNQWDENGIHMSDEAAVRIRRIRYGSPIGWWGQLDRHLADQDRYGKQT